MDREHLLAVLSAIGSTLEQSATLCLFGSGPGIALGQPDRQSEDMDVWRPASDYDDADLRQACGKAGVMFDPKGEIEPGSVYMQIVRPGVVRLPSAFTPELLGRWGKLTVVTPSPALLAALKLVRASARDLEDVVWWVKERALSLAEIRSAASSLPGQAQREAAAENLILVELVSSERDR